MFEQNFSHSSIARVFELKDGEMDGFDILAIIHPFSLELYYDTTGGSLAPCMWSPTIVMITTGSPSLSP